MKYRLFSIGLFAIILCGPASVGADEYTRFAIDSTSVNDGAENGRNFNIGGADFFDAEFGPSYGLAPFRFHPRDFSLSEVSSIDELRLSLTNEVSVVADTGMVEVFYLPDSRTDLGIDLLNDPDTDTCSWASPHLCYDVTYNPDHPGGIDPADFSAAPVSLGVVELDFGEERFTTEFELDVPDGAATSLIERINAGEGFHLAFGAVDSEGFLQIGSFNSRDIGAFIRPQLTIDASGTEGGISRDLIRQGAIHVAGDTTGADFYASGNDDDFSEFGIANFQFTRDDFGMTDDIADIGSVQLTLHHNDRAFADGNEFEVFLVPDTAEELGYDEFVGYLGKEIAGEAFPTLLYDSELDNGLNPDQFVNAPISLGTQEYAPKNGGTPDTFDLELSDEAKTELLNSINAGDDFHLVIAITDPTSDATYSGLNNAFDPGNPQLTISLEAAVDPEPTLDLDGNGMINVEDAALLCSATDGAPGELLAASGILAGDADLNGSVEFADFLVLSTAFGGEGHFGQGDFDCDGQVAFADFLTLSTNFGQTAEAAAVPEPSSALMFAFGFLGLLTARKRHA